MRGCNAIRNCCISVRGAILLHPFGTHTEGVQFYCPSSSYPAIVLLELYSLLLNYKAIFDTSAERIEAHMVKVCIINCSTVKLYNTTNIKCNTFSGAHWNNRLCLLKNPNTVQYNILQKTSHQLKKFLHTIVIYLPFEIII